MTERICTIKDLKEYISQLPDNTPIYSYDIDYIRDDDENIVEMQDVEIFSIECEISPSGRLYMRCYNEF